jgi:hypothetical protein
MPKVPKVIARSASSEGLPIWHFPIYLIHELMGQPYSVFNPMSQKKFFIVFHPLPPAQWLRERRGYGKNRWPF